MNATGPLPLRLLVADSSERFPLRLLERISALVDPVPGIEASRSTAGVILSAVAEQDFDIALQTIREGLPGIKAGPVEVVYLTDPEWKEPYVRVIVCVPEDYYGDVVGDLNRRFATIESMERTPEANIKVTATAPLAELLGYISALQGLIHGTAEIEYEFLGYKRLRPPPSSTTPSGRRA